MAGCGGEGWRWGKKGHSGGWTQGEEEGTGEGGGVKGRCGKVAADDRCRTGWLRSAGMDTCDQGTGPGSWTGAGAGKDTQGAGAEAGHQAATHLQAAAALLRPLALQQQLLCVSLQASQLPLQVLQLPLQSCLLSHQRCILPRRGGVGSWLGGARQIGQPHPSRGPPGPTLTLRSTSMSRPLWAPVILGSVCSLSPTGPSRSCRERPWEVTWGSTGGLGQRRDLNQQTLTPSSAFDTVHSPPPTPLPLGPDPCRPAPSIPPVWTSLSSGLGPCHSFCTEHSFCPRFVGHFPQKTSATKPT